MGNFFAKVWESIINSVNKLAENADIIVFALIKIILIIIAAKIIIWISNGIINRIIKSRKKKKPESLIAKKSETIGIVLKSIIRYAVYFFMFATILGVLGLGITAGSILATAGIGGLALGLGAQGLIKDVVSGFFLLFENQFAVGDFVEIRDIKGKVEAITVRTTQIRVWTGELVIVQNGSIDKVINYTRGNIITIITVYIAVNADVDKAVEVIKKSADKYMEQNGEVAEQAEIAGVTNVGENGIEIKAFVKVLPMTQFKVERELKAKIYGEFKKNGIEIPFPKRVVIDKS